MNFDARVFGSKAIFWNYFFKAPHSDSMDLRTTLQRIYAIAKQAWVVPVLAVLCGAITVIALFFFGSKEYSSEIKILVVQKYTLTDSYTAAKSAEKISKNLAEVIRTSSFFDKVVAEGVVDFKDIMALPEKAKRDEWARTVDTEVIPNTSLLKIVAYDSNPNMAKAIANSVADVLITYGADYHGAPDTIALQVVDSALTSTYPTRPNLVLNGLAAAFFGAVLGAIIFFLQPSVRLPLDTLREPVGRPGHLAVPVQLAHKAKSMVQSTVQSTEHVATSAHPASTPQYQVLHVANFHNTIPSHSGTTTTTGEVRTLPSSTHIR